MNPSVMTSCKQVNSAQVACQSLSARGDRWVRLEPEAGPLICRPNRPIQIKHCHLLEQSGSASWTLACEHTGQYSRHTLKDRNTMGTHTCARIRACIHTYKLTHRKNTQLGTGAHTHTHKLILCKPMTHQRGTASMPLAL